jgi:hypothetical protein
VIEPTAGEPKAGGDVLRLEVGHFLQNLLLRQPGREEIKHIDDPDAHPADARATSALGGVDGDAIRELGHDNDRTADALRLPGPTVTPPSP